MGNYIAGLDNKGGGRYFFESLWMTFLVSVSGFLILGFISTLVAGDLSALFIVGIFGIFVSAPFAFLWSGVNALAIYIGLAISYKITKIVVIANVITVVAAVIVAMWFSVSFWQELEKQNGTPFFANSSLIMFLILIALNTVSTFIFSLGSKLASSREQ